MEDKVILEMDQREAFTTLEALRAARAFLANYEQDAAGIENSERMGHMIVRLFEAIPDGPEGGE